MKEFTQTNLDVDPEVLPSQAVLEAAEKGYHNALNAYLEHHHGLVYAELEDYAFSSVDVRDPGFHLLIGPTVRTTPERRIHHCVVGRYGEAVWDPHPTRAGLARSSS